MIETRPRCPLDLRAVPAVVSDAYLWSDAFFALPLFSLREFDACRKLAICPQSIRKQFVAKLAPECRARLEVPRLGRS